MQVRPVIAGTATVYTDALADATLEELLEAAADDCWPNNECDAAWALLRNWAIQTETLAVDVAENAAWERAMRELAAQGLPYTDWVAARGEVLKDRLRARKLAQASLRYKYGYRGKRRWGLKAKAVRDLYRATGISSKPAVEARSAV